MSYILFSENYLAHHGILGQKWGKRNGPPYPLGESAHSASDKAIQGFNADERNAVTSYTDEAGKYNYHGMNDILRGVASKISSYSLLDRTIINGLNRDCASALKKSSLKETMITYRGVSNSTLEKLLGGPLSSFSASDLEGFEFTEKGFGSSSVKKSVASSFISSQSGGKGGVLLKTITPAGSQALCVESISTYPSEAELLTQNNSRYRIHDAVFNNGVLTELLIELVDSSSVC